MKLIFVILSIEASFCLNDCIISISEDGSSTNPEIHWNPLVQKSEVKSLIDGENSESYTVEENVELQVIFLKDKIKIDFFFINQAEGTFTIWYDANLHQPNPKEQKQVLRIAYNCKNDGYLIKKVFVFTVNLKKS